MPRVGIKSSVGRVLIPRQVTIEQDDSRSLDRISIAIWAGPLSMPMKSSGQRMIPAARGTEHVCVLMRIGSLLCGSVDAPLIAAGRHRIFQLAQIPSMPALRARSAICSQERIFRADVKALG